MKRLDIPEMYYIGIFLDSRLKWSDEKVFEYQSLNKMAQPL